MSSYKSRIAPCSWHGSVHTNVNNNIDLQIMLLFPTGYFYTFSLLKKKSILYSFDTLLIICYTH